jgi:hypothetical protein
MMKELEKVLLPGMFVVGLQVRGSIYTEGDGLLTLSYEGNLSFSGMEWEMPAESRLRCRLPSVSSSNGADYFTHKPSGTAKQEESMDLRLKLAI